MSNAAESECRLFSDPPSAGTWNMAVDEHLLQWTSEMGRCCWRFYQWEEPTLSLGYFQQYGEREAHAASRDCPVVRRASGGGAILHDCELTYSMTVPLAHPLGRRRQWTYEAVHRTLIDVLAEWEIEARLHGDEEGPEGKSGDFLCFQRRSPGDIVLAGVKIVGSAQRRAANAILQHGSILLRRSVAAPELAGLCDVSGVNVKLPELMVAWQQRLADVLRFRWFEDALAKPEEEGVATIAANKYGHPSWTMKSRD